MPIDLTIVIPAFNEKENIPFLVSNLKKTIQRWPYSVEVLIVNDGSSDGSREILDKIAENELKGRKGSAPHFQLRIAHHQKHKGFGAALKTGYKNARGKVISTMDADLTHNPEQIRKFMNKINEGYDMVIGSRYVEGGKMVDVAWYRRLISDMSRVLIKILFNMPIKDVTNGFRAVRKQLLDNIELKSNSFNILPEMVVKARKKGYKITEVPMTLTKRKYGVSKMNPLKDYTKEILTLFKLRIGWRI